MRIGLGLSLPRAFGGASVRPFTPLALGGNLLAWSDAGVGVTTTGSGVSSWVDRKSGYDAVQATDANRPPYSATGFNGAPGLTTNGTSQFLNMESQPFPTGDGNIEVWLVFQNSSLVGDAGTKTIFTLGALSPQQIAIAWGASNALFVSAGGVTATATGPFSSRHVVRGIFKTGQISISVDGGTPVTAVADPDIGSTRVRIAASMPNTPTNFLNGKIRDVIVTRLLDAGQASALQTFVLARRML